MTEKDPIRQALEQAMDDLLEGRVPGPLTGLRLVELAGVNATGSPTTTPTSTENSRHGQGNSTGRSPRSRACARRWPRKRTGTPGSPRPTVTSTNG